MAARIAEPQVGIRPYDKDWITERTTVRPEFRALVNMYAAENEIEFRLVPGDSEEDGPITRMVSFAIRKQTLLQVLGLDD